MTQVLGVVGGSGGVGASTFAAVLAATGPPSLLLDIDVSGGGIDVLLGIESAPGARWSGLKLAGGYLPAAQLLAGLPEWAGCRVLAADTRALTAPAVEQVLDVVAEAGLRTVVIDLPRAVSDPRTAALDRCALVVLMARSDVSGVVAAHAVADTLGDVAVGVLLRRGELAPTHAAELIGAPLIGTLRAPGSRPRPIGSGRPPRPLARVACAVRDALTEPARL